VLKSKTTLLQAISLRRLHPVRQAQRDHRAAQDRQEDERIIVSYERILSGRNPEQNLTLEPGDTVVVP